MPARRDAVVKIKDQRCCLVGVNCLLVRILLNSDDGRAKRAVKVAKQVGEGFVPVAPTLIVSVLKFMGQMSGVAPRFD